MKSKIILVFCVLAFVIMVANVSATWVDVYPSNFIEIQQLQERDLIVQSCCGNESFGEYLDVQLIFWLWVDKNFTDYNNKLNLSIRPFEFYYTGIDQDFSLYICNYLPSVLSDFNETSCDKKEIIKLLFEAPYSTKNFSEYIYTLNLPKFDSPRGYWVVAKYKILNFIKKNGDYHIAWMNTNCPQCTGEQTRYVILPSKDSILERVPENAEIGSSMINDNIDKWYVTIKGTGKSMIYYRDAFEINSQKFFWQFTAILITFIISLILTLYKKDIEDLSDRIKMFLFFVGSIVIMGCLFYFIKLPLNLSLLIIFIFAIITISLIILSKLYEYFMFDTIGENIQLWNFFECLFHIKN